MLVASPTVALALLLTTAAAGAAPAHLNERDLEQAAAAVQAAGPGARVPAQRLAGKRFRLTIVPRERGEKHSICSGLPSWGWYESQGLLEITLLGTSHHTRFFLDPAGRRALPLERQHGPHDERYVALDTFSCRYEREPIRPAKNMYDEIVDHEPITEQVVAIAEPEIASRRDAFSRFDWIAIKTDKARAEALGRRIVVRLTGVVGEWSKGRSIVCGADDYSSLGDPPVLIPHFSGCLINGRVDRVDYVDSRTGKVLLTSRRKRNGRSREWKDTGPR